MTEYPRYQLSRLYDSTVELWIAYAEPFLLSVSNIQGVLVLYSACECDNVSLDEIHERQSSRDGETKSGSLDRQFLVLVEPFLKVLFSEIDLAESSFIR